VGESAQPRRVPPLLEAQPIRIDAPSALLGFFLALRLQGHDAHVVEAGQDRWVVELSPDAPRDWVLARVQRWLDDEALEQVAVHMDGRIYTMTHS
jgi:hypothetical protein